jgi:hypothetical protein
MTEPLSRLGIPVTIVGKHSPTHAPPLLYSPNDRCEPLTRKVSRRDAKLIEEIKALAEIAHVDYWNILQEPTARIRGTRLEICKNTLGHSHITS